MNLKADIIHKIQPIRKNLLQSMTGRMECRIISKRTGTIYLGLEVDDFHPLVSDIMNLKDEFVIHVVMESDFLSSKTEVRTSVFPLSEINISVSDI